VLFNQAPRREGVLRECWYSSTHSLTSALDEGILLNGLPIRLGWRLR